MVFFRKFFLKIIISTIIIAFLIISPYPLFSKINKLNYSLNKVYNFNFSGVIELWNVDTFEGGSVSRAAFLEKRAIEFEKKNKGVFISVNNLTLNQLKLNLEKGKKPHIITFGIGVEDIFINDIISLNSAFNVRDDLIKSSIVNEKIKAIPIMMGGYSLISNKELTFGEFDKEILDELVYATTDFINPLMSLFVNNINAKKLTVESLSSFDAYDKFINNKYKILLGTQRDYYRCKNRENNLKMQCDYNVLSGFSDLIVYASIFKSENKIENISQLFLEYLLSSSVQTKLSNINMFPVIQANIYTDSFYKNFNEKLLKDIKTLNVFYSIETLNNIKELLIKNIINNENNEKEILKYLM